jgi:general stress protein YciG
MTKQESKAAQVLGRKGGRIGGKSRSEAKVQAVRENGKKGGWHTHKANEPWYAKAAREHMAADKACGRDWVCACAPCRAARQAQGIA